MIPMLISATMGPSLSGMGYPHGIWLNPRSTATRLADGREGTMSTTSRPLGDGRDGARPPRETLDQDLPGEGLTEEEL